MGDGSAVRSSHFDRGEGLKKFLAWWGAGSRGRSVKTRVVREVQVHQAASAHRQHGGRVGDPCGQQSRGSFLEEGVGAGLDGKGESRAALLEAGSPSFSLHRFFQVPARCWG